MVGPHSAWAFSAPRCANTPTRTTGRAVADAVAGVSARAGKPPAASPATNTNAPTQALAPCPRGRTRS
ncbi:MAG: hypothetical protein NT031_12165 [Planctomycetota bacterium]|nr:hypothetical protein [Planctomycetota bacterium]